MTTIKSVHGGLEVSVNMEKEGGEFIMAPGAPRDIQRLHKGLRTWLQKLGGPQLGTVITPRNRAVVFHFCEDAAGTTADQLQPTDNVIGKTSDTARAQNGSDPGDTGALGAILRTVSSALADKAARDEHAISAQVMSAVARGNAAEGSGDQRVGQPSQPQGRQAAEDEPQTNESALIGGQSSHATVHDQALTQATCDLLMAVGEDLIFTTETEEVITLSALPNRPEKLRNPPIDVNELTANLIQGDTTQGGFLTTDDGTIRPGGTISEDLLSPESSRKFKIVGIVERVAQTGDLFESVVPDSKRPDSS